MKSPIHSATTMPYLQRYAGQTLWNNKHPKGVEKEKGMSRRSGMRRGLALVRRIQLTKPVNIDARTEGSCFCASPNRPFSLTPLTLTASRRVSARRILESGGLKFLRMTAYANQMNVAFDDLRIASGGRHSSDSVAP